ncbi:MAG TPA: ABC transporter permease [Bacteroidota bacterium]|nr:ABC transporter permease [Bacteroidota bacterium]
MRAITAVVYREYLVRITSLTWMFFDLAVPLLYLLMFGVAFDRALGQGIEIDGQAVSYNAFFLAGVLSMTSFGNALNQSYGFFVDRDNGILYEFLTYPMTRGEFLLGKILFQCGMTVFQSVLTIGFGALLLGISVPLHLLVFVFIAMVVGTAGWFFLLATVTFLIRRNDTFTTVINVMYFVLMFLSSVFYPLDRVPAWLKAVSTVNPLTWHADILRHFTLGIGSTETLLLESAGFIVFSLGSFWLAVRTLQKTI